MPVGDFRLGGEEKSAILEVLERGRLSEGALTREFERRFAEYIGTRFCVATSSGTGALMCLFTSLIHDDRFPRFRPGARVITTPLTYASTSNAILLSGLRPVFADVDRETFGILPEKVEEILCRGNPEEYCAILPVHLMGYPCRMDELDRIARNYDLLLLEDAAQAHGSRFRGKACGSIGMAGIFSFYIAHNIQAGEMGCVTTDDDRLARLVKQVKANGRECDCHVCTRSQGTCPRITFGGGADGIPDMDPRFRHEIVGYNFKVMEFQPALGLTQLRKADGIFQTRQGNVRSLNERLAPYGEALVLPRLDGDVSYLAYPLVVRPEAGRSRAEIRKCLEELGVETRPLFGCLPLHQPAYAGFREEYRGRLPNADFLGRQGFYLGCHQYLEPVDLDHVARSMGKALGKAPRC